LTRPGRIPRNGSALSPDHALRDDVALDLRGPAEDRIEAGAARTASPWALRRRLAGAAREPRESPHFPVCGTLLAASPVRPGEGDLRATIGLTAEASG
jgi:hypothetical protein